MKRETAFEPGPPAAIARQSEPWQAHLTLGFADDHGTTRLVERRHSGPLRVQKPLYPESPAVCHAIIVHPPGGIVGGDRLSVELEVGANASAFIASPGAAKWYRANGRTSRQQLRMEVGPHASLEWMPQETIFFEAAQVELDSEISLAAHASYIGCEILCLGRTASGERFESGSVAQRTRIRRDGKLIWFEQGRLQAGARAMSSTVGMAGNSVCATLIAAGKPAPAALLQQLREELEPLAPGFGVTQLKQVLVARYIGNSSEAARHAMLAAWRHLRPALLGHPGITPRIWNT
ncbi:urease accessory protein UreD [Lacisediminimonas profundi]|uniref:urease accessory protein UreD n=1 Tax=Lacisediminimonas profundi TaxID=2603856 RepID=UPI00124B5668|nr:urease accessory protein UreD [Lacisediminimonas profundi]